jgi:DegV family protein with EDD domain
MSFVVITDTSSNLPTSVIRKYGIEEISFPYYMEGKTCYCTDTDAFDSEAFYAAIAKGATVTTSQITPQRYIAFYEPFLKEGKDILFVAMSSGISGSCSSAKIGAQEILEFYPERRIEVVDTIGASLGEGLLSVQAAELRDQGMALQEAADLLRKRAKSRKNPKKRLALAGRSCYNYSALRTRTLSGAPFPAIRAAAPNPVEVINKNRRIAKWQSYP